MKTLHGERAFPREQDLEDFAASFARALRVPLVIWLRGDLGTGKTTFARGLIHALGYGGRVKSPTYTLLEQYEMTDLQVLHMDLYRIGDPGELEFLGVEDLLDGRTVLLAEWPDRGGHWLPPADFVFEFRYASQGRKLHWAANSPRAQSVAAELESTSN